MALCKNRGCRDKIEDGEEYYYTETSGQEQFLLTEEREGPYCSIECARDDN